MCGIFGYVGGKEPIQQALDGLKKLEYRGYDSAGFASLWKGSLIHCKQVGKVSVLQDEFLTNRMEGKGSAIAHTRWATHGRPTQENAHPHLDQQESIALVHNGIIENYDILRHQLKKQGATFVSDTDTEVLAKLIGSYDRGNILDAICQVLPLLEGTFAVALVHRDYPDQIIAFARHAPLSIGISQEESFVSSDPRAFPTDIQKVFFLDQDEIAVVRAGKVEIFDKNLNKIIKKGESFFSDRFQEEISKGDYPHYTLKEIDEQPVSIRNALYNRYSFETGTVNLEGLNISVHDCLEVERVVILGCGSSYHAGLLGSQIIQDLARIPASAEIASEYRYSNPVIEPRTLAIVISQSGETADTVAALRELKTKGAKVVSLCNVPGSTLAREADGCVLLRAGAEIGVCSTKAFTNQVVVLSLLAMMMARVRHMTKDDGQTFLHHLLSLPEQVQSILDRKEEIRGIAERYVHYENFFFLGRRYMFPTSLEGALKLKEISYINASGYPGGEIKHGPIALINELCPTVAYTANVKTYSKILSNLMEIKARNGKIVAIAFEDSEGIEEVADEVFKIPKTIDPLACITSAVVGQLLAYYIALERGADIDQPRNLAKSVTVE